ncbi:MAG: hypothetical protein RLZZ15_2251, partial [Verrucomicrobiota bacterium]
TPVGSVSTVARSQNPTATDPSVTFSVAGIAVDRSGDVYFSDSSGAAIRKMTASGVMTTHAGSLGREGSADGVAAAALFRGPSGLAFDPAGNLVVADGGGATLRRITPEGTVTTIAGQPYPAGSGTTDGVGGGARFFRVYGVAFDRAGNLYVPESFGGFQADFPGAVVRRGVVTTAAGPPIITTSPSEDGKTRDLGAHATLSLSVAATGTAPLAFQWLKNNAPITGATAATLALASLSGFDEGVYTVRVSNAAGAVVSPNVTVRVFAPAFEAFASRRAQPGGSFLWGVASGGGLLVAVGTAGKILTSTDGQIWTTRSSGTTEWLVGVTSAAGKFVVVGDKGTILVSSDAVTWTRAAASGTTQRLNNVAFGDNRFVAVGEGGAIVTSTDAQTWTPENSGVSTWLRGLVYDKVFYASGQNGEVLVQYGKFWGRVSGTYGPLRSTHDVEALVAGPVGVGQDGWAITHFTMDLSTQMVPKTPPYPDRIPPYIVDFWASLPLGLSGRFRGLCYGVGAYFATGENGIVAASQSLYGPWSFIPTGTTANLIAGVFHGNSMFVVGENETILQSQPLFQSKLVNIATRGLVGADQPMIAGFVVAGTAQKQVLVRVAGPALTRFGVPSALGTPTLRVFDEQARPLATNSGWSANANSAALAAVAGQVGAFPFAAGSADAAVLLTLPPGAYTAQVTGGAGIALVEVYDTELVGSCAGGPRVINLATRGLVGDDANQLIAGFVVSGSAARRVLIRGVGPTLAQFGVPRVVAQPQLALLDQRGRVLERAGAWGAQRTAADIAAAAVIAGAFALDADSADAALVTTLLPGNYTVQVSGATRGATGTALVEVYDLP